MELTIKEAIKVLPLMPKSVAILYIYKIKGLEVNADVEADIKSQYPMWFGDSEILSVQLADRISHVGEGRVISIGKQYHRLAA